MISPNFKANVVLVGSSFISILTLALPTEAATLSQSRSDFKLTDFSHLPISVGAFTDTDTSAEAFGGSVNASADAEASFESKDLETTVAENSSLAEVQGSGLGYSGVANGVASILGIFEVDAGESFSFDYSGSLELRTSVDQIQQEIASAFGQLGFVLSDNSGSVIDYLNFSASLNTPGQEDSPSLFRTSDFGVLNYSLNSSLGGTQEFVIATFDGSYRHNFDTYTEITLRETKVGGAEAKAIPTPSPLRALIVFFGCQLLYRRRKSSAA